jgi:hypothetical protein
MHNHGLKSFKYHNIVITYELRKQVLIRRLPIGFQGRFEHSGDEKIPDPGIEKQIFKPKPKSHH